MTDLQQQAQSIESNWKDGGPLRVLMHAGIGLSGGGVGGPLGAATSATVTPQLGD